MFKYVPVKSRLRAVEKENFVLKQETRQTKADLDFVAIMCNIEIPEENGGESDAQSDIREGEKLL